MQTKMKHLVFYHDDTVEKFPHTCRAWGCQFIFVLSILKTWFSIIHLEPDWETVAEGI